MMKQPTRGMITAHLGQPYHDVWNLDHPTSFTKFFAFHVARGSHTSSNLLQLKVVDSQRNWNDKDFCHPYSVHDYMQVSAISLVETTGWPMYCKTTSGVPPNAASLPHPSHLRTPPGQKGNSRIVDFAWKQNNGFKTTEAYHPQPSSHRPCPSMPAVCQLLEWRTPLHLHCKAHLFLHRLSVASALSMLPILILTFPTHRWHRQWHSQSRTSQVVQVLPLVDASCPSDGFPHLHRPATLAIHRDVVEHPLALKSSRTAPRPRIDKKLVRDSVDDSLTQEKKHRPKSWNIIVTSTITISPPLFLEIGEAGLGLKSMQWLLENFLPSTHHYTSYLPSNHQTSYHH